MITEFEKQIMLTEKTNELLKELQLYTEEAKQANEANLTQIKQQVEVDMQEIVDYCIRMGIPKNQTGSSKPSEYVFLQDFKKSSIAFKILYDRETEKYEWYVGYYSYGIGYTICDGLFCVSYPFSNYQPVWNYGFLGHDKTESEVVQYICSNWKELKTKIISEISKQIAKENERKLQGAYKNLERRTECLVATNKELRE